MTPDGLSGLLMLVILWSGGGWWCRQAWSTSRDIVEYRWEELGNGNAGCVPGVSSVVACVPVAC